MAATVFYTTDCPLCERITGTGIFHLSVFHAPRNKILRYAKQHVLDDLPIYTDNQITRPVLRASREPCADCDPYDIAHIVVSVRFIKPRRSAAHAAKRRRTAVLPSDSESDNDDDADIMDTQADTTPVPVPQLPTPPRSEIVFVSDDSDSDADANTSPPRSIYDLPPARIVTYSSAHPKHPIPSNPFAHMSSAPSAHPYTVLLSHA